MAVDNPDDSKKRIHLVRIEHEAGVSALQAADAIAMTFAIAGCEYLVFALKLSSGDCGLCAFGPVPRDVQSEAKAVAKRWLSGDVSLEPVAAAAVLS